MASASAFAVVDVPAANAPHRLRIRLWQPSGRMRRHWTAGAREPADRRLGRRAGWPDASPRSSPRHRRGRRPTSGCAEGARWCDPALSAGTRRPVCYTWKLGLVRQSSSVWQTSMLVTGNQLRAARALRGVEHAALAGRADPYVDTGARMVGERAAAITGRADIAHRRQSALEAPGVEPSNHERPGLRGGS